jgi:hypothetical protein
MIGDDITPFNNAEEAWFWFMQATQAKESGARIRANQGLYKRPCEPTDIFKILERLHRHRRLTMHHFRILRHYGLRMVAPDITRAKEVLASRLWDEAMEILTEVFISKNIVERSLSAEIIDFQKRREAVSAW